MRRTPLFSTAQLSQIHTVTQGGFWGACVLVLFAALGDSGVSGGLWDKGLHFTAFFTLATLAAIAYPILRLRWIGLGLLLFGLAIEAMQKLPFVGRDASWADFVADGLGVSFALVPIALERLRRQLT